MSTKPKAKKYRIKPSATATPAAAPAQGTDQLFAPSKQDGFGDQSFLSDAQPAPAAAPAAGAKPATAGQAAGASPAQAIDAIRQEGLTGRQLRMARRVAQKQGLSPTSDYDAVRLLRAEGIDPFKRASMMELVANQPAQNQNAAPSPGTGPSTGPGTAPGGGQPQALGAITPKQVPVGQAVPGTQLAPIAPPAPVPSTQVISEPERARGIIEIQRDIARRRRKRASLLIARLFVFVMLPTFIAGYYFFAIATPMYATKSEFVIQQADSSGAGGLGSGLLAGTGLANSVDSITVQGYLQSRDAMLRLDADEGFRSHFSQDFIDPIQRLESDSSQEDAYKKFKKSVKIGFDPTEGIIKMEVIAADPETSANFAKQLISYAEQQVDQLTARLRGDQMSGAQGSREEAEAKMQEAQERIVTLQEQLGVLSPEAEAQAIFAEVQALEQELTAERLSLSQFEANDRPNQAKVSAARNKIATLRELIVEKRALLTSSESDADSLARVTAELQVAQQDLAKRFEFLAAAEAQFEAARLEANRQVRYLSVAVSPVAPDEPTYPKAFENTLLAFLIFSGVYLMVSLTSSILREQV